MLIVVRCRAAHKATALTRAGEQQFITKPCLVHRIIVGLKIDLELAIQITRGILHRKILEAQWHINKLR